MKKFSSVVTALTLGVVSSLALAKTTTQTPQDPALINRERIAYWLEKNNQLSQKADAKTRELAIDQFIGTLNTLPAKLPAELRESKRLLLQKQVGRLIKQKADGKTVNVLTVLIDFPDLPYNNNRLTDRDTSMYYSNYSRQHYQDMMFGTSGFAGPQGQTLKTARQYYAAESDNDFVFNGTVFNWVRADNNAVHYGGNTNGRDSRAQDLVKEAVTKAYAANTIDLNEFDNEDPYDSDRDGNTLEPDGFIDYVMVFHSSIGEEAGGGVLKGDAIWSHRFNVGSNGMTVGNSGKKLFDYTIQPIDAAIGVIAHEFGHALGLPDEYDTGESQLGEPVGMWSIMSGGSWAGINIPGADPTSFSAYARDELQRLHGGNWISEQRYTLDELNSGAKTVQLVDTNNHTAINQLRVDLPPAQLPFKTPYSGAFQYYSGTGHLKHHSVQFSALVPNEANVKLTMKAHWHIEADNDDPSQAWDYIRVYADNTALAGNRTTNTSTHFSGVDKFISGKSSKLTGAEGEYGWVDTEFPLSAFAGRTVTFKIEYVTDEGVNEYGFVADNIRIVSDAGQAYSDDAESNGRVTLNGFERIGATRNGLAQNYWLQLRSVRGNDNALTAERLDPGVVLWFNNPNYTDNRVGNHPGYGFIGVVDSDQVVVMNSGRIAGSGTQVRDAAFSRYTQMSGRSGDTHLDAQPTFNDANDYSAPQAPEAGLVLPKYGFTFTVSAQANDSSTATIQLSNQALSLSAAFDTTIAARTVSFTNHSLGGNGNLRYDWNFGDGSAINHEMSPQHAYAQNGSYTVTLTVFDADNRSQTASKTITVAAAALLGDYTFTADQRNVTFTSQISGGTAPYQYDWNFGDGSAVVHEANPSHTFSADGSYSVTLNVRDADGVTRTVNKSVVVSSIAALVMDFTFVANELSVQFTSTVSGGVSAYTYAWNFGDGSSSTQATPSHVYSSAGTYTVTLTVTDSRGTAQTSSKTVVVTKTTGNVDHGGSGGGGSFALWLLCLLPLARYRSRK